MKKSTVLILILLPLFSAAQNFKSLVAAGDSLSKLSKNKQALNCYDRAIESVINSKQTVSNLQWFNVLNSAANLAGKNYKKYDPANYGVYGAVFLEIISSLKKAGVKCIFTFNSVSPESAQIAYIYHPNIRFYPTNNTKVLFWAANDCIYIRAFGDNIYPQIKLNDKELSDYLELHSNEFVVQDSGRQRTRFNTAKKYVFRFYRADGIYDKTVVDRRDLYFPSVADTSNHLSKILPSIRKIAEDYHKEQAPGKDWRL